MTVTARSRRAPLTGAALVAATLLATGCGPYGSSSAGTAPASPAATVSGAAAPSSGGGGAPSSGSGASAAGTSGSGTPACTTSDLKATVGGRQGAAGSDYTTIDFTNAGSYSCTLYGYPGMSLANSGGPIGASATRDRSRSPAPVTLAPGAKANAALRVVDAQNYPSGTCSPDSGSFLLIYPPNQTEAIDLPFKSTGCKNSSVKLLSVSVVTPGAGGATG